MTGAGSRLSRSRGNCASGRRQDRGGQPRDPEAGRGDELCGIPSGDEGRPFSSDVNEPNLLAVRSVESRDCLGRRFQQDLAAVFFEIGLGFRRQVHIAHLTGAHDDFVASLLKDKPCLVFRKRVRGAV